MKATQQHQSSSTFGLAGTEELGVEKRQTTQAHEGNLRATKGQIETTKTAGLGQALDEGITG